MQHSAREDNVSNIFGEYLKQLRLSRKLTLRLFCEANGFDPGNYSKIERGVLQPPKDEQKLDVYRRAFNLHPKSEEWRDLQNLASISRGEIPYRVLINHIAVANLPALFRTLENSCISPENFDKVIDILQGQ